MLHTAIPQLPHVIQLYLNYHIVTYNYYLNYHMLHTAIPQLPTCYIQLLPQLQHTKYHYNLKCNLLNSGSTTIYEVLLPQVQCGSFWVVSSPHTARLVAALDSLLSAHGWGPHQGLCLLAPWVPNCFRRHPTWVIKSAIARHAFQELVLVHCRTEPFRQQVWSTSHDQTLKQLITVCTPVRPLCSGLSRRRNAC